MWSKQARPVLVGDHNMAQIRTFIYAKRAHEHSISGIMSHHLGTGVGGVGRNKGGVAISMDLGGTSLCFVNTHLAAHMATLATFPRSQCFCTHHHCEECHLSLVCSV